MQNANIFLPPHAMFSPVRFAGRALPFAAVGVLSLLSYAVLTVKTEVREIKKDIMKVSRAIDENRSELHVLKAEWEYLNDPARLKMLSERYLSLRAASAMQVQTGTGALGAGFFLSQGGDGEKLEPFRNDEDSLARAEAAESENVPAVAFR